MHRKLKILWDRHEGWAAPLAMVFFLIAGLQIGARLGSSEAQLLNAETIKGMQTQIALKDEVIKDKDVRLRAMQDHQMKTQDDNSNTVAKSAGAAVEAAKAAQVAAEAAKSAASTMGRQASEFPPKPAPRP